MVWNKKKFDKTVGEKRTFAVTYPLAGSVTVYVDAESEEEAVELGWDKTGDDDAEVTWEVHEKICEGNVLYANFNDIEVEDIS